jgi:hypothetical protein
LHLLSCGAERQTLPEIACVKRRSQQAIAAQLSPEWRSRSNREPLRIPYRPPPL